MFRNLSISLGHAAIDFYMNTLPTLLPFFIVRFDLSFTLVGVLIAVRAVAGSFTQPLFGFFVDKGGKGANLIFSLIWLAILTALVGRSPSYLWLILLTALGPLGSGLYHPLGSALLREGCSRDRIGTITSAYIVTGTLGYALAPIIVIAVVLRWDLAGTMILALPGLFAAGLLLASGIFHVKLGSGIPVQQENQTKASLGRDWVASRWQVFLLSLTGILRSWTYVGLVNFLPIYYVSQGYPPEYGSYMLSLYLVCGSIGTLVGGRLSDQWGRKQVTVGSLILAMVMLSLYLLTGGMVKAFFLALTGFTLLGSMSVTTVHAQELMIGNTAMASGLMMGLVYGIGGIGAAFSGRIADIYGLQVTLATLVVVLIPAIFAIIAVPDPHGQSLKTPAMPLKEKAI